MKLINNFLAGVQAASLAEAIAIIERSSLDRDQTIGAIVNGSPGSPVMKTLASRILADDFSPNFYLHLLAKDLGYAIGEGESRGVPMTMASAALGLLQARSRAATATRTWRRSSSSSASGTAVR